jgi:hypothetical protein
LAAVRRAYIAAIAVALLVFLAISALLARVFSANGAEQSAITSLVQAEARGDDAAMARQIKGCDADPSCRQRVAQDAEALRRAGTVSILQLQTSTDFSVTSTLGTARVAWRAGQSLPIVQCVRVRRTGNAISGLRVELLEISERIQSDANCPARF